MIILKTLKGITKLSISGSAISGVVLIDLQTKDVPAKEDKALLQKIKSNTTSINSIEEVALYEKTNGCTFAFSFSDKLEKLYTGEEFLKQAKAEKPNTTLSKNSVFEWARSGKDHCNSGVVTIFREGEKLRLGEPAGGWGA